MNTIKWPDNARAAVVLMIDDLTDGYLDIDGSGLNASCDWGRGCRQDGSVFSLFEERFLAARPDVAYTVFLPVAEHAIGLVECSYERSVRSAFEDDEFKELLRYIVASGNEIAYHGHHHGSPSPTLDTATWRREHEWVGHDEYRDVIASDIRLIESELGVKVRGGKSPGYDYDQRLIELLDTLPLDYWAFDYDPGRSDCRLHGHLIDFPCNFAGSRFSGTRGLLGLPRRLRAEGELRRVIELGGIVSIQEHFLSTRPDGARQTPNIHDDLDSLNRIFDYLEGFDLWYATCAQVAEHVRRQGVMVN